LFLENRHFWRIDMKIMILAAAALVATTLSAAADHEGKADPPSGVATNEVSLGEPGVAGVARYTGAVTAYRSTVSKVDNGEAEEALGVHLPVGVDPGWTGPEE
jgi:hypothetical protein